MGKWGLNGDKVKSSVIIVAVQYILEYYQTKVDCCFEQCNCDCGSYNYFK